MPAPGPNKRLCGAQRPNQPKGVTCTQVAGWGTNHTGFGRCKRHGGAHANGMAQAERERAAFEAEHASEIARSEMRRLGMPLEVDPGEALIEELWECAGNVEFYRQLVQQLPTHPEPDLYYPPVKGETEGYWQRGEAGIYGNVYHVSGTPTGEAKAHILVQLYNRERDRKAAIAEAAIRLGIDARRLEIAEADATRILSAQVKALITLGMGDRLEEFREAFTFALREEAGDRASLALSA